MHDESKIKLCLAAPMWPMGCAVTGAFLSEGRVTRHAGVAQPSRLEDELSAWLEVLMKQ